VRVQSSKTLDDGRVMVIMSDGTNRIMATDDGKPARGIDAERLLANMTRDYGKTLDGSLAGYGSNRETVKGLLPKPPTARPGLDQFVRQPGGKPAPAAGQKPPLDAFLK
jgi:hypothetical protein